MISNQKQEAFIALAESKLTPKELSWVQSKMNIVSDLDTSHKFKVFFSLASRFVSTEIPSWSAEELTALEDIYPGFGKSAWSRQDLARVLLMLSLDTSVNQNILIEFFEIAEMREQIALYKGLYLLGNASHFNPQVAEGIRTNMANVFDAIASGNPYPKTYLEDDAWNQLILKSFFMDRKLYTVQFVDEGKNKKLGDMLQDYVKERWAAGRQVSPEIWRMINGYIRKDIIALISKRQIDGIEKEAITAVLAKSDASVSPEFWDNIGKTI
ncbi:EboA domain-containing protein [Seonamhaeicola sp.]|uniref:EboA domain-containing protein n=1 Tax=Seonamhaeicola sp. TaxID=1912245 RepID=UPI00261A3D43|nr:EboA domain-containing protein [Seonamhaeicola sp.]